MGTPTNELDPDADVIETIVGLVGTMPDADVIQKIKNLVESHLDTQNANEHKAENDDAPIDEFYRDAARERYGSEGSIEIEQGATISRSDSGAYVQGWLWVDNAPVTEGSVVRHKRPPIVQQVSHIMQHCRAAT